jgi:hypothetical protein
MTNDLSYVSSRNQWHRHRVRENGQKRRHKLLCLNDLCNVVQTSTQWLISLSKSSGELARPPERPLSRPESSLDG